MERIIPIFGIAIMIGICLAFSNNRRAALKRWDLMAWGFGLQLVFALLVLKTKTGEVFFQKFNDAFVAVINVTNEGSAFVFGSLATGESGFYFAFSILPTIIFFSALTSILYHLRILQLVVKGIAYLMQRTMKTSGAETLSASANIFVGQTEAPLVVRPFLNRMTQSELMTVMTGGFATVAGGVMAFYVSLLVTQMPNVAGHLLAASIMSAPAALVFGKLFVPETGEPETRDTVHVKVDVETHNLFEAATVGTSMGLSLALNVGAMLIAFIALIGLVDLILAFVGGFLFTTLDPETKLQIVALPEWWNLRGIMGFLFSPLAYLMGITDWGEAKLVGQLLGVKTVANEAVAYTDMGVLLSAEGGPLLSPRAQIVATYALCGFSNFSSIGIQIGALAVMAPDRRTDLSRLALRAMIAGIFACCSTACIAAILL